MNIQTAFVCLKQNNKILLIQEGGELGYGLWSIPGGHLDDGETPEQGALREGLEEAGYEIELMQKVFTKVMPGLEYLGWPGEEDKIVDVHVFEAKIIGGELTKGGEELDIRWVPFDEVKNLPLRFSWIMEMLN